jgi:hypothetical protein
MKLSLPPKLVEKLVWVPVISFCKIFIPSYAFDALLCRNWLFSPPNRLTLQITLMYAINQSIVNMHALGPMMELESALALQIIPGRKGKILTLSNEKIKTKGQNGIVKGIAKYQPCKLRSRNIMFITHTCELSQFSKFVMSQRQLHLESKI